MKGAQDFLALLKKKNNEKINMKKFFSTGSKEQHSEIAILFSVVEKPYNYVFGDDLLPQNPRGRGYKLQTLTSAYI